MTAQGAPARASVPTGNTFDKYAARGPVARRLMGGFLSAVDELFMLAAPDSVLDVGCGEGVLTAAWAERLRDGRVVGLDLQDAGLRAQWAARSRSNLGFMAGEASALPFERGEFGLVAAIESLEHLPEPRRALEEMARVARSNLLVSVPREPLWRALNLMRGAYPRRLGNTPGHLQHWSRRQLLELLEGYGRVVAVRSPPPWTMALVRVH
jgi:SAM-dependent methyltransferase